MSGVPSGGGQIFDVSVGNGGVMFDPDSVNISVGDTVRWTWSSNSHSVTSGDIVLARPMGNFVRLTI